jgi:hypothetical protein
MKYNILVKPKGSNIPPKKQEIHADNRQSLHNIMEQMNMEVLEIIDEIDPAAAMGLDNPNLSTNQLLKAALNRASKEGSSEPGQTPQPPQGYTPNGQPPALPQPPRGGTGETRPPVQTKPVEFKDGNVSYKMENGKVYKKAWVECDSSQFRVVQTNLKNPKIITENISIEKLDWVLISGGDDDGD